MCMQSVTWGCLVLTRLNECWFRSQFQHLAQGKASQALPRDSFVLFVSFTLWCTAVLLLLALEIWYCLLVPGVFQTHSEFCDAWPTSLGSVSETGWNPPAIFPLHHSWAQNPGICSSSCAKSIVAWVQPHSLLRPPLCDFHLLPCHNLEGQLTSSTPSP